MWEGWYLDLGYGDVELKAEWQRAFAGATFRLYGKTKIPGISDGGRDILSYNYIYIDILCFLSPSPTWPMRVKDLRCHLVHHKPGVSSSNRGETRQIRRHKNRARIITYEVPNPSQTGRSGVNGPTRLSVGFLLAWRAGEGEIFH